MKEIFDIFNPIYKFFKFFGYFPFNLSIYGVESSVLSILYTIFINFVIFFLVFLRFTNGENYSKEGSALSKVTLLLSFFFSAFFYNLVIATSLQNRAKFLIILKKFEGINKMVKIDFKFQKYVKVMLYSAF